MNQLNSEKPVFGLGLRRLVLSLLLLSMSITVWARPLTVGSLSDTPSEEISTFLPFVKYLAAGLGELGIDDAQVRVSRNYSDMVGLMKRGEVDLFIDSSMSASIVQRRSGGEFLARRWKKGRSEYRSVVFVRMDSPIHNLTDLAGRSITFDEPFSSSGYLLPASEMRSEGLNLIKDKQNQAVTEGANVRYRFSFADENTLLWVLHGRTDAGAMAEYKLTKLSAPMPQELRVIHRSHVIPYHVVVNRPGLSDALRQAIHTRLLNMENSDAGQQTLKGFEKTTRFDDIPAEALRSLRSLKLDLPTENK